MPLPRSGFPCKGKGCQKYVIPVWDAERSTVNLLEEAMVYRFTADLDRPTVVSERGFVSHFLRCPDPKMFEKNIELVSKVKGGANEGPEAT